jgi:hypothetical protein
VSEQTGWERIVIQRGSTLGCKFIRVTPVAIASDFVFDLVTGV